MNSGRELRGAIVALAAVGIPVLVAMGSAATFDVASIRPATAWKTGGEGSQRSRIEYSPKSLTMRNVDLTDCVEWAYGVKSYQISGKGFPNSERYDILAKTGEAAPAGRLRTMLQNLLASRFQLAVHRETKLLPVYEMVIAKGGPKLPAPKAGVDGAATHAVESLPRVQDGGFVFSNASMADFAEKLSELRGIDLPVVDRTGIPGVFDITLKSAADAILHPDGPSLFTLIQEQLGLKLVSAKAPTEVLVIDHVAGPSAN